MYLCYVDETGLDDDSPAVVTVGVLVEGTTRLVKTNREWTQHLGALLDEADAGMPELKSSRLYRGLGKWNRIPGDQRHARIEELIDWFVDRKHHIALAAADKDFDLDNSALEGVGSHELLAAFHISLQVQRAQQTKNKNKGVTLFAMDQSRVSGQLADLLENPPSWSDDYYARKPKADPLDQLVHTPFWVRSDRIELVQLADLFAFVYRRYLETRRDGEDYPGEFERLNHWKAKLDSRLLNRSHRLPTRETSSATDAVIAAFPAELQ